jgi:hypothetical protein
MQLSWYQMDEEARVHYMWYRDIALPSIHYVC